MQRYKDHSPTQFDTKGLCADRMGFDEDDSNRAEWFVLPVIQTRDSGPFEVSNFTAAENMLLAGDPKGCDHENHRFGHWGPGWFEILIVRPGTWCETEGACIEASLENYPLLDEDDFSEREWEGACEIWRVCYNLRERIKLCADAGVSIFAARREDMPGECFGACRPEN